MTGDHHGQTAGTATLLVKAVDEISGTHKFPWADIDGLVDQAVIGIMGLRRTQPNSSRPDR
jgi:hypothetical protein